MLEVGRFASLDTLVPDPGNLPSFNRYSYSFNNPVNYIDPSGHDPLDAAWEEAFRAGHGRAPEWYDRLIRLFSIAYPEEWEWSTFYDSNGYLRSFETLEEIMINPSSSRSWANMDDALSRMSAYYNWNEIRDICPRYWNPVCWSTRSIFSECKLCRNRLHASPNLQWPGSIASAHLGMGRCFRGLFWRFLLLLPIQHENSLV